jgi:hypothetical protein
VVFFSAVSIPFLKLLLQSAKILGHPFQPMKTNNILAWGGGEPCENAREESHRWWLCWQLGVQK